MAYRTGHSWSSSDGERGDDEARRGGVGGGGDGSRYTNREGNASAGPSSYSHHYHQSRHHRQTPLYQDTRPSGYRDSMHDDRTYHNYPEARRYAANERHEWPERSSWQDGDRHRRDGSRIEPRRREDNDTSIREDRPHYQPPHKRSSEANRSDPSRRDSRSSPVRKSEALPVPKTPERSSSPLRKRAREGSPRRLDEPGAVEEKVKEAERVKKVEKDEESEQADKEEGEAEEEEKEEGIEEGEAEEGEKVRTKGREEEVKKIVEIEKPDKFEEGQRIEQLEEEKSKAEERKDEIEGDTQARNGDAFSQQSNSYQQNTTGNQISVPNTTAYHTDEAKSASRSTHFGSNTIMNSSMVDLNQSKGTIAWQTTPWPEKKDDDHRERRIRKKNRPPQIPLRERTFYGCSSIDQYDMGVKLGQGTFGEVKKASHFLTGVEVALKKVTIHEEKDGMPITAIREIKLLKKLSHPSIIAVIDMAYRSSSERGRMGEVYMVEPYMDHDLNGMLENPNIKFSLSQIKLYMKQLFEGTLYMHQNKIMHRDMKAANLLINNKGQLQIADFGLARPFHDPGKAWDTRGWQGGSTGYTSMVVTRWYRPPELLAGDRKYGPPIDMWGLGCILAEMINRKPIFQGSSELEQLELISKICGSPNEESFPGWNLLPGVKNADPNGRPDQEPDVPGRHDFGNYPRCLTTHFTSTYSMGKDWADLIDKLLVLNPCNRMTAKEALEHEWFWQSPYPADPNSLPSYQASKELDRQRRDQQKFQQRAAQAQYQQQQQQQHQQQQHQQHLHALSIGGKPGMGPAYPSNNFPPRPPNGSYNGHQGGGGHNQYGQQWHGGPPHSGRPVPRMNFGSRSGQPPQSQTYNRGLGGQQAHNPYDDAY